MIDCFLENDMLIKTRLILETVFSEVLCTLIKSVYKLTPRSPYNFQRLAFVTNASGVKQVGSC